MGGASEVSIVEVKRAVSDISRSFVSGVHFIMLFKRLHRKYAHMLSSRGLRAAGN
jgi:hypothetical protein